MALPRSGKDRARASRLRAKRREEKQLTEEEISFLEEYDKEVGGVSEADDSSEDNTDKPDIEEVKNTDSAATMQTLADKIPTPELKPDTPKAPVAKRIESIPVGQSSLVAPVVCTIAACPCKRQSAGVYCPVLKRKVYPNFGREISDMYARGLFGFIKLLVEFIPGIVAIEASEDELRTVSMGVRSLQEQWDQLAAISGFINPIFGIIALIAYTKRTVKDSRNPPKKALPAST